MIADIAVSLVLHDFIRCKKVFVPHKKYFPDSLILMLPNQKMANPDFNLDAYEKVKADALTDQILEHNQNGHQTLVPIF